MAEKVLVVDDTPANMSILVDMLEPQGYAVSAAPNGQVGLNVATRLLPDIILLDIMMPELDGLETCRRLKANSLTAAIPVLFISARNDAADILEGFRAGGADYIVKPFQPEEVLARMRAHLRLAALARALQDRNAELTQINEQLLKETARRRQTEVALHDADQRLTQLAHIEARRWGIEQFVGKSAALMKLLATIRRLQNFSAVSVLITGESGTGKELVARAIHHGTRGPEDRPVGPFVAVNCVALPEGLAEAALFGRVKGSTEAAASDHKGWFELADGGTLFLDEIGDLSTSLQARILRVLEDGEIRPIGGDILRKVNVRIMATTNTDLHARMKAGIFRRDLFYRLAQFTVHIPPLRDRLEDVLLMAEYFLKTLASEMGLKPPRLSNDASLAIQQYSFPGNVRELINIIERALIECGGKEILSEHLCLPELHGNAATNPPISNIQESASTSSQVDTLPLNLEKAETYLINRALAQAGGNVAKAARLLGINRSRIYRRGGA
ncbi:MAG TPA: sigma-54 dependent transcriptional regulator [Phycisphaerae bacterium]|jgi:DNA-binding NtrC family response regulator